MTVTKLSEAFEECHERLTSNGKYRFNARQLRHEIDRQHRSTRWRLGWLRAPAASDEMHEQALGFMRDRHPQSLVQPIELAESSNGDRDLYDYAFDYLLVVDDQASLDFLISNNFHFQAKAMLVQADGTPKHLWQHAKSMVDRYDLPVFLFHDCSRSLCHGFQRQIEKEHFPSDDTTIVDLGLWPADCWRFARYLAVMTDKAPVANQNRQLETTLVERAWLATGRAANKWGYPPGLLLRILAGGIARHRRDVLRLR